MQSVYLSTSELARQLHVSPSTVRYHARRRNLPFVTTPGGHRRFLLGDVEAALGRGHRGPARPAPPEDDSPLSEHVGRWVALAAPDVVIVAGDSPAEVIEWLRENRRVAEWGMMRVPSRADEIETVAGG